MKKLTRFLPMVLVFLVLLSAGMIFFLTDNPVKTYLASITTREVIKYIEVTPTPTSASSTPSPSPTSKPSSSLKTNTPRPTATPRPTRTPVPWANCTMPDSNLKTQIDQLNATLSANQVELNALLQQLIATDQNDPGYQALVDTYNAKVDAQNVLNAQYNDLHSQYNSQVAAYNSCIGY